MTLSKEEQELILTKRKELEDEAEYNNGQDKLDAIPKEDIRLTLVATDTNLHIVGKGTDERIMHRAALELMKHTIKESSDMGRMMLSVQLASMLKTELEID